MRTDLTFARNVDELRRYGRRRGKWSIAVLLLLILAGAGTWGYVRYVRDDPRSAWEYLAPWLRSKGRALAGRESLRPFLTVIERSELTAEEKTAWTSCVEEAWTFAEKTGGDILSREDVINQGRRVVESRSGLFYALEWVGDQDLAKVRFDAIEKKAAGLAIRRATEALKTGQCSADAVARLRADAHVAMLELGAGAEPQAGESRRELETPRLRVLLRTSRAIGGAVGAAPGGGNPADMAAEFRKEMEAFGTALETKKRLP
ncbi:MAG: hypothetical protein QME60_00615 [Verrucomicrobiota bacterium]|nr:hypothetical protein [Verrucomicrobiota bacterium]